MKKKRKTGDISIRISAMILSNLTRILAFLAFGFLFALPYHSPASMNEPVGALDEEFLFPRLRLALLADDRALLRKTREDLEATFAKLQRKDTVSTLFLLAGDYLENIRLASGHQGTDPLSPAVNEIIEILGLWADMEKTSPVTSGTLARFTYASLKSSFPVCSFSDQKYYLNLFHHLLSKAGYNESLTYETISWCTPFFRPSHSGELRTQIADCISSFVQENSREDLNQSLLQAALQEKDSWKDAKVLSQIRWILYGMV